MGKRGWTRKFEFTVRPSDFGSGKTKHAWSAAGSLKSANALRASAAKRQEERTQRATEQIMRFYKPGWAGFSPKEMASRTAIARALQRNGIVTAITSEPAILPLLVKLENQGKIKLPPRTIFGGARKKKITE